MGIERRVMTHGLEMVKKSNIIPNTNSRLKKNFWQH